MSAPSFHSARALLLAVLLLATPWLARAEGGDALWLFQGIEDINAMATLPDVDGDGVPDVVIETYDAGGVGDHLYLVSGGDSGSPAVLWSTRPESGVSNGGGYGDNCLAISPDLSGDAFPDVLLGTAWGNRSVHAVDGRTGDVLWTFDTYDEPESGWVYSVASHPDRTLDGIAEVVFGAGSNNETGYLLDGADGSVIWRFHGAQDAIGLTLSLPDVDGDSVADVLFCGWDDEHRVFCVSGAGGGVGQQIWARDTGASNHGATVIDDITDDGVREVVIGNWSINDQVRCLDGASGLPVWDFDNGTYQYIMRLVTVSDMDGDGKRDIAVGSWDNATRVLSGRTGALIWESFAGSLNGGDFWSVDRVEDVNGDGRDEVVGGSFDTQVYLFNGANGDTLWMFPAGYRLYSVRGTADLSGNFIPDVLGGTQYLSSGGRAYAIEGGSDLSSVGSAILVDGEARIHAEEAGRVDLSWTCNQDLSFNLYRYGGQEHAAAERRTLELLARQEDLADRELLSARLALADAVPERLNALPIAAAAEDGGVWSYSFSDRAAPGTHLVYRLAALLPEGGELTILELRAQSAAAATASALLDASLEPNPFNPATTLRFELARAAEMEILVHDARGRRVAVLARAAYAAGPQQVTWQARDDSGSRLPSGLYLFTLAADGGERRSLRAVLLK